jgi:CheY-like chemotaxis protein
MYDGGANYTILVVDDDEDVRYIARAILEDLGYETIGASSGAGALQVLATEGDRIAALFSDIMMPGMNGFELAQQAEMMRPDLKIILTSGYMAPEMAKAMSIAMWPAVPKPWRPAQLANILAEVLGGSAAS